MRLEMRIPTKLETPEPPLDSPDDGFGGEPQSRLGIYLAPAVDILLPVIRRACEHVGQPSLWVNGIELACLCRPPNYAEHARIPQYLG
jgi:hypothetical protein